MRIDWYVWFSLDSSRASAKITDHITTQLLWLLIKFPPKSIILQKEIHSEGISLTPSANTKGSQITELLVSNKVTNYCIYSCWILGPDGFLKNYMGSRPESQKFDFIILVFGDGWIPFFSTILSTPFNQMKWNWKHKTYHYFNKMKRWLVFGRYRPPNISTLF